MKVQFLPGNDGKPAYAIMSYDDYQTLLANKPPQLSSLPTPPEPGRFGYLRYSIAHLILRYLMPTP